MGRGAKGQKSKKQGRNSAMGKDARTQEKSPIRTIGAPGGTKKTHEAEALGEKDTFFKEKENLDFLSL